MSPGVIAFAEARSLTVCSYGGEYQQAQATAYFKPFEAANPGVTVQQDSPESDAKLKAMVEANAVDWDVVQLDSTAAANFAHQGLLEQLDYGVINKSDLLNTDQIAALKGALHSRFPQAEVVTVSARTGANLDDWFERLSGSLEWRPAMEVDYDVYAFDTSAHRLAALKPRLAPERLVLPVLERPEPGTQVSDHGRGGGLRIVRGRSADAGREEGRRRRHRRRRRGGQQRPRP